MKKWLIGVGIFVVLAIACIYILIPATITFGQSVSFSANPQGFYRALLDDKKWHKWWPVNDTNNTSDNSTRRFSYNGRTYTIDAKKMSSILISIAKNDAQANTTLNVFPLSVDSIKLVWEGKLAGSNNPIKRLQTYFQANELESDIKALLDKMFLFYSKTENIYGTDIRQVAVIDSILISTFATSNGYPATSYIYDLIGQLKEYIANHAANETGSPMLNITTADSINYLTKVAIPVNKELPPSGNISYRWMMGGGKILITEVKGGPGSINESFRQIENYVADHRRTAPAIPFLSLVTDRMKEPDTSKWVTRIYYPVM